MLRLRDLWQSFGSTYHFGLTDAHSDLGTAENTTEHNFVEEYRIGAKYSLLNPHLLNGNADLGIATQQDIFRSTLRGNSNGNDVRLTYSINGLILDSKPVPVTFSNSSTFQRIQRPFSKSYNLETDNHTVGANLRNSILPTTVTYSLNTYETSGMEEDRDHRSETVSLSSSHSYGISNTVLRMYRTEEKTEVVGRAGDIPRTVTQVDVANSLVWNNGRLARQIDTSYLYNRDVNQFRATGSSLNENIRWDLGKALEARIQYRNSSQRSNDIKYNENSGNLSLIHHLFESLTTSLTGSATESDYSDGNELGYGGGIGLTYHKKLPAESDLTAGYGFLYHVTDRQRTASQQRITNEPHIVPALPPFAITLPVPNIDANSIVVSNTLDPSMVFHKGETADYLVEQPGGLTRIVILETGSIFQQGITQVSISYTFLEDPEVKYATLSHSVNLRLSLLGQSHIITARFTQSDQDLLGGNPRLVTISPSTYTLINYERRIREMIFGGEYGQEHSSYTDNNHVQGYWRYGIASGQAGIFFNILDQYTWYGNSSQCNSGENMLRGGARYRRSIANNTFLSANVNFSDTHGLGRSTDTVSVGVDLQSRFGMTFITVTSTSDWLFGKAYNSYVQNLVVNLYRLF